MFSFQSLCSRKRKAVHYTLVLFRIFIRFLVSHNLLIFWKLHTVKFRGCPLKIIVYASWKVLKICSRASKRWLILSHSFCCFEKFWSLRRCFDLFVNRMIDSHNGCHIGNGIIPGLGEIHHRCAWFWNFVAHLRESILQWPLIIRQIFFVYQRTTQSMKRKRCNRASFSRSRKVERNIFNWDSIAEKMFCGTCSGVCTQIVVLRDANSNYAFNTETENFHLLSLQCKVGCW